VVGISSEHSLPLKRILVEGLVIVASILLAFGIDAAWDVRQERRTEDQLLRTLLAEIDVNREELDHRRTQGAEARSASSLI
jgi:uncharacterized membrane protein YqjE